MLATKAKYYHNWNKFVSGKMKDETACIVIEEFVGLNPKMYSHLVDDNIQHKKIVATISHNEYKDVLQNKKYFRYSINRIQSKDHRIGNYEISKISLPCFDDRIYIQSNGFDALAFGDQS